MWGVILSVTWPCGPPTGMKRLFHCHPSTSVILSEVAAATESKDPYAAHSLSTGTFFDGAERPQRISAPLLFWVPNERRRCARWGDCASRAGAESKAPHIRNNLLDSCQDRGPSLRSE